MDEISSWLEGQYMIGQAAKIKFAPLSFPSVSRSHRHLVGIASNMLFIFLLVPLAHGVT